jgi:hypothetical protein
MAYKVEWKVTNHENPDKVYETVLSFWQDSTSNQSLLDQHHDVDVRLVIDKDNTLAEDGKSIVHWKEFSDEDSFNQWKTAKELLPAIDEDLTFTRI